MAKRKTLKAPRSSHGVLSVESLFASFSRMDDHVRRLIERGGTDSDVAALIRSEWSSLFHHTLSPAAVKGLVLHYRKLHKSPSSSSTTSSKARKTRKHRRNQRGGMAPISYMTGPGLPAAATYGRFPDDFSTSSAAIKALDLNRFYESGIAPSCDKTGTASMSQRGGGIFDSLMAGHAPMSVPRNPIEIAVSAAQGAPITNPPAAPEVPTWTAATPHPAPFETSAVSNLAGLAPVFPGY